VSGRRKEKADPQAQRRGVFVGTVAGQEPLCPEHFELVLDVPGLPPSQPGQFVSIGPILGGVGRTQLARPLLKRPFSIAWRRDEAGTVRVGILYRVVGVGTSWMASLSAGAEVQVIGPSGKGFAAPRDLRTAVLLGGGTGIAPLIYLAKQLHQAERVRTLAFFGARCIGMLPLRIDLGRPGPTPAVISSDLAPAAVAVATDDGSAGFAGTVVEAAERWIAANPGSHGGLCVFACGPEPMLAAVAAMCEQAGLPCQVSLEKHMSCGVGTCQSCVVKVKDPSDPEGWSYKLCCTDGPAFDACQIVWE